MRKLIQRQMRAVGGGKDEACVIDVVMPPAWRAKLDADVEFGLPMTFHVGALTKVIHTIVGDQRGFDVGADKLQLRKNRGVLHVEEQAAQIGGIASERLKIDQDRSIRLFSQNDLDVGLSGRLARYGERDAANTVGHGMPP